jgi:Rha family phage regulatory protein
MSELSPINPHVFIENGHAVTTSLNIAAVFGKQHKNVLQSIDNLECSDEFSRLNFQPRDYVDERGKVQPMIEMTRDGFTFLVMGYTGTKAAQFKEAYIARFNQMERQIAAGISSGLPFWQQKANLGQLYDRARTPFARQTAYEAIEDLHRAHGKPMSPELEQLHRRSLHEEPEIAAHFWDVYEQSGAEAVLNHSSDQALVAIHIKQAIQYLTGQSVSLPARAELMRALVRSRRYAYLCQQTIRSRFQQPGESTVVHCWIFRKPAPAAAAPRRLQ